MGWGASFLSSWRKAGDAVKQKVAQVATTAKKVVNNVVTNVQNVARNVAQKAQKAADFIAQQTVKAAQTAKKAVVSSVSAAKNIVTNTANTVKNQITQAVETAKKNIPLIAQNVRQKLQIAQQNAQKVREQAAKVFNKTKSAITSIAKSTKTIAKSAFNKIKKAFTAKNIVKKVVQICPVASQGYALAETGHKMWQTFKGNDSNKSKAIQGLSSLVSGGKSVKDLLGYYKDVKGANNAVKAIKDSAITDFWGGVGLDLAVGGITGGLDNLAKNVDRKDISTSNKTGRVVFGAAKGASQAGVAAGMGAATGAAIGAVIGFVGGGVGAAPGAVVGAKLGATFLTPLFEKPAEWVTNKVFTEKNEERAGKIGEAVSSAVKGVWGGALNLIRGPS